MLANTIGCSHVALRSRLEEGRKVRARQPVKINEEAILKGLEVHGVSRFDVLDHIASNPSNPESVLREFAALLGKAPTGLSGWNQVRDDPGMQFNRPVELNEYGSFLTRHAYKISLSPNMESFLILFYALSKMQGDEAAPKLLRDAATTTLRGMITRFAHDSMVHGPSDGRHIEQSDYGENIESVRKVISDAIDGLVAFEKK